MGSSVPTPATVQGIFDQLGPPGTPFTTPEVAAEFDCSDRTIYNRLDTLVEEGAIETKKVGAKGRVWWKPVEREQGPNEGAHEGRAQVRAHPVFESDLVGVIVWGEDVTIRDANDAFLEMAGLDHEEALGTSWRELTPEEFYPDSERQIEQFEETGSVDPYEKQYYHADGSRWWGIFESRQLDDGGSIEFVVDITERKQAEIEREEAMAAFRESEERYRTLFESIDEGFCIIEMLFDEDDEPVDYRFLEANPAFEDQTGLTDAEGELMRDLEPEHEEHWFQRYGRIARTGEPERFQAEAEHLDGRWFNVYAFRIGEPEEQKVAVLFDDITERKEIEDALRESQERLDSFVTATSEIVYRMSPDWSKMYYLDGKEFVVDTEGSRETWLEDYIPPDEEERVTAAIEEAIETKSTFELEHQVITADGTRGWVHARAVPILDDDGDIVEWFGTSTDITERMRAEERIRESEAVLKRLNTAGQELLDADPEEIKRRTADLVQSVLDVEYAALWRYDDAVGELDEYATRTSPGTDPDAVGLPAEFDEQIWQTFIGDDVNVDNDVEGDDTESAVSPLRSRILAPLGRHGVICAGSTRADVFDERMIDLVETVAATVETAWDRAESEAELERQNAELLRLDRLNTLIREIDQTLVQAETVEAINEAVCDRLAVSATFEFAWIGEFDADANMVSPREWAGIDSTALERLTTVEESVRGESPFIAAVRTGDIQVVTDIATDPRAAPWREAALERGGRSCLCIPLVYDESVYGVLAVYGGTPQPDERDVDVLSELGETIAHAIHTVETRVTQRTDNVVELTLRTTTAETPLVRLARETDSVIEVDGLVPGADGDTTVFFTVRNISPDEVVAAAEQSLAIEELIHLTDRDDGSQFKARLPDTVLAERFLDRGATIRSLTIDAGTATAVVELSETADVRGFIEGVKRDVSDLELLARTSRTRSPDTREHLRIAFEQRLTPRQQEILHLAYRSGYFESPRVQTGKELSDALDLSQSTFNHHLRGGERKLLETVFDHV